MSDDIFVETKMHSSGSRLGNSLFGILFGLVLIIGSIVLIWWNEGNTLERVQTLEEGLEATISLTDTNYNPAYDNQLVHLVGKTEGGILHDPLFGVHSRGLVLLRDVTMYQWRESSSDNGTDSGRKTYHYTKEWSSSPINSSAFRRQSGHRNSPFPYKSERFFTKTTLGDFTISKTLLNSVDGEDDFKPTEINTTKDVQLINGEIYHGTNPNIPKIGDLKITYKLISEGMFSIVAKQTPQKSLTSYMTPNGGEIAFIYSGEYTAEELYKKVEKENYLMAWGFRAGALMMMFVGFLLILNPLAVLFSFIPFIGSLIETATLLIALLLTAIIGGGLIVFAWFAYFPWLIAVLLLFISYIFLTIIRKKRVHRF